MNKPETAAPKWVHPHQAFIDEANKHLDSQNKVFQEKTGYGVARNISDHHTKANKKLNTTSRHDYSSSVTGQAASHLTHEPHEKAAKVLHTIAKKHGFVKSDPKKTHMYKHPTTGAILNIMHPGKQFHTDRNAGFFLRTPKHKPETASKEVSKSGLHMMHPKPETANTPRYVHLGRLTHLEQNVMSVFTEQGRDGIYSDELAQESGISKSQISGVIASLVKKKILYKDNIGGDDYISMIDGIELIASSDEITAGIPGVMRVDNALKHPKVKKHIDKLQKQGFKINHKRYSLNSKKVTIELHHNDGRKIKITHKPKADGEKVKKKPVEASHKPPHKGHKGEEDYAFDLGEYHRDSGKAYKNPFKHGSGSHSSYHMAYHLTDPKEQAKTEDDPKKIKRARRLRTQKGRANPTANVTKQFETTAMFKHSYRPGGPTKTRGQKLRGTLADYGFTPVSGTSRKQYTHSNGHKVDFFYSHKGGVGVRVFHAGNAKEPTLQTHSHHALANHLKRIG